MNALLIAGFVVVLFLLDVASRLADAEAASDGFEPIR
jgi:hypothetical protein